MATGPEKVASLLLTLDRDTAAELLRRLPESDRENVTRALTSLSDSFIGLDVRKNLLQEFRSSLDMSAGAAADAEDVCKLLSEALGEEAAQMASQDPLTRNRARLSKLDGESLAYVLSGEHPQVVATILMELGPEKASVVMPRFGEAEQRQLFERMVTMRPAAAELVTEVLEAAVEKSDTLEKLGTAEAAATSGGGSHLKTVATILNQFEEEPRQALLGNLEERDPHLAQRVKEELFTFDDLMTLGPREVQKILATVDTRVLALALKGASEEVTEFLFGNVSKRTQERVNEERETMGAVRLSEVKQAQQDMAAIARDLIQRGEIQFAGGGGEELVT